MAKNSATKVCCLVSLCTLLILTSCMKLVNHVQIKQTKLTYVPPEQRAEKNATRTAFGHDYEQRIREEAGDEPEKKAKRKHQIHSLYHQAKMKVRMHCQMPPRGGGGASSCT